MPICCFLMKKCFSLISFNNMVHNKIRKHKFMQLAAIPDKYLGQNKKLGGTRKVWYSFWRTF